MKNRALTAQHKHQTMRLLIDLQLVTAQTTSPKIEQYSLWVKAALQHSYENLEQTIRIVDEDESQQLNRQYRGRDKATNVLSFPATTPHLQYQCLGDLVICATIVQHEAQVQKKSLEAHWAHLVIHGMLHLQGIHHDTEQDARQMEALEIKILSTLGYSNPYNAV